MLARVPHLAGNPHVFAGRAGAVMYFASQRKRQLDQKLGDMPHWTAHDLRRTARSLLSRAGVRPDIAERVLGHAIAGVEGVYDRHLYDTEKAEALAKLAALVERVKLGLRLSGQRTGADWCLEMRTPLRAGAWLSSRTCTRSPRLIGLKGREFCKFESRTCQSRQ